LTGRRSIDPSTVKETDTPITRGPLAIELSPLRRRCSVDLVSRVPYASHRRLCRLNRRLWVVVPSHLPCIGGGFWRLLFRLRPPRIPNTNVLSSARC
jgi:hypothetical protein